MRRIDQSFSDPESHGSEPLALWGARVCAQTARAVSGARTDSKLDFEEQLGNGEVVQETLKLAQPGGFVLVHILQAVRRVPVHAVHQPEKSRGNPSFVRSCLSRSA